MYETLLNSPPDSVQYHPHSNGGKVREDYTLYGPGQSLLRRSVDGFFGLVKIPRCIPVLGKYDLVHSCRGFFPIGMNPFVVDIEHVSSFAGMGHTRLHSRQLVKLIEKWWASKQCRRVLPHSEAARDSMGIVTQRKDVLQKARVMYPAVSVPTSIPKPERPDHIPVILFMGEYYWKGGREFLAACDKLSRFNDFRVTYISLRVHPPESVIRKAKDQLQIEYVEGPLPRTELFSRIYPSTDIFVMPTYIDTFGYSFLEAMAHGIPCIGTHHFAVPEIVENEVTGLLVKPPLSYFDSRGMGHPEIQIERADTSETTNQLATAMNRLIDSESLRARMGIDARRSVLSGKFSIPHRNRLLKAVYEESINR